MKIPKLALGYNVGSKLVAVSLSIPLTESGWHALTAGEIEESEVTEAQLFDPARDTRLGLHWYHVEVLEKAAFPEKFYVRALQDMGAALAELNCEGLQVVGFSSLSVSPAGIALNEKLGQRERSMILQEYVVKIQAKLPEDEEKKKKKKKKKDEIKGTEEHKETEKEGQQYRLVSAVSDEEAERKCREQGWTMVNRIKMLVLLQGEPSLIWDIFQELAGAR